MKIQINRYNEAVELAGRFKKDKEIAIKRYGSLVYFVIY